MLSLNREGPLGMLPSFLYVIGKIFFIKDHLLIKKSGYQVVNTLGLFILGDNYVKH
jgi:hypothetical protein